MKNFRLDISYDGTNYSGWQSQPNSITIEGNLIEALNNCNIKYEHLMASGRTDAGVHATKQVVSFQSDTSIPADRIKLALNTQLPNDIRIKSSQEVIKSFNSHNSAIGKKYTYYIDLNQVSSPIAQRYSWHFPYKLNWKKLYYACSFLSGEHDYINFRSTGSSVKTTTRNVNLIKPILLDGNFLKIEFIGNGFLYNMVRILTGTIIEYANSKISDGQLAQVFEKVDRNLTGITAPAKGLFLTDVFYNENEKNNKILEINKDNS